MDVITPEGEVIQVEGQAVEIETEWSGESPFFLIIEPNDGVGGNVGIDLDESGWIEKNKEHMRRPGAWHLVHKESGHPVFVLIVEEGDQPYFVKHHVGTLMSQNEIVATGIGKKRHDGTMVRLWIFPNGMVCGGDDVDAIAMRMLGN